MRVVLRACVAQLDPCAGAFDVRENMKRADALLRGLEARDGVGLVVLPELGFSRYVFDGDVEDARACASAADDVIAWAKSVAMRLRAHVAVGHAREEGGRLFNSQTVVNADGGAARTYDKTHLYPPMDECWAEEGVKGFESYELDLRCVEMEDGPDGEARETTRRTTCVSAICMDINPYKFEAPWEAYELATACAESGAELIIFSSAWTNAHPDDDLETKRRPVDFDETVSYWVARLAPLIGKRDPGATFVCANRIGVENDIQFTGCSCVIDLRTSPPRLRAAAFEREEVVVSAFIPLGPSSEDASREELARVFTKFRTARAPVAT